MRAGYLGQIKGPFLAGQNVLEDFYSNNNTTSEKLKFGISIDEKDLLPFGDEINYPTGLSFSVEGPNSSSLIQMGRTGMYESDDAVQISRIIFSSDVPESVIINFVIY